MNIIIYFAIGVISYIVLEILYLTKKLRKITIDNDFYLDKDVSFTEFFFINILFILVSIAICLVFQLLTIIFTDIVSLFWALGILIFVLLKMIIYLKLRKAE